MTAETEGRVYNVAGQDWDEVVAPPTRPASGEERIVVNMGPQHPSTHGVLRLILEIEGETVIEARRGASATCTPASRRTWSSAPGPRASRSCTRMDYLSPLFNETAYCLGVERLLGIEARSRSAPT